MNPTTPDTSSTPDDPQRKYRRRQRYLRIGQVIMAVGFIVAFIHWLAHLEAFGPAQPEGWVDLAAGYPMGVLLVIIGAVLASKKPA